MQKLYNESFSLWERYAPSYSKVLPNVSFYEKLVDRIVFEARSYKNVLDLGCGPGIMSEKLANNGNGHFVLAVDNDKTMLDYASQRLQNIPFVKIRQMNADFLEIEKGTFDAVICNNVICFVGKPLEVLKEIFRVLDKNGILIIAGPRHKPDFKTLFEAMCKELYEKKLLPELSEDVEVIVKCNKKAAANDIAHTYSNEEMENLLLRVGFSKILTSDSCYLSQSYFIIAEK